MPPEPLTLISEAQLALDELWQEKLIPFSVIVSKIITKSSAYTLVLYDSRLPTVVVPMSAGTSFGEMVKSAVLSRTEQLNGPLKERQKH